MEWSTTFLPDDKIVLIETSGIADEASSVEMAKIIFKSMARHLSLRCLIDHSAISSVSGSAVEIYDRPKRLVKLGLPFEIRIAEVVLPEHREHFRFLETVFRNRGFAFYIFDDRESARQWLIK